MSCALCAHPSERHEHSVCMESGCYCTASGRPEPPKEEPVVRTVAARPLGPQYHGTLWPREKWQFNKRLGMWWKGNGYDYAGAGTTQKEMIGRLLLQGWDTQAIQDELKAPRASIRGRASELRREGRL